MNYKEIPNHLVKAILVTLFCCLPFGVIAIVFAAQVSGQAAAGNYEEAQRLSKQADLWGNVGLICGLVGVGLYVVFVVLMMMAGVANA